MTKTNAPPLLYRSDKVEEGLSLDRIRLNILVIEDLSEKEEYTLRPIVVFNPIRNNRINYLFFILFYELSYHINWQRTYFKENAGLRLNTQIEYEKPIYISIFIKDIFEVVFFISLVRIDSDNILDISLRNLIINLSQLSLKSLTNKTDNFV